MIAAAMSNEPLRDSARRVDEGNPAEIPTQQSRGLTGSEIALVADSARRVDERNPAEIATPQPSATPCTDTTRSSGGRGANDASIAAALAAGDHHGVIALSVREFGRQLGRLAFAMLGTQAEADDVVQETFVEAFRSLGAYRGEGTLRAWLFGIARRLSARRLDVRARQSRRQELLCDDDRGLVSTEDKIDGERRSASVRAALATLRPTERESLILRFAGELSHREVALACGIDEATARQRVVRALGRLRAKLNVADASIVLTEPMDITRQMRGR